MNHPPQDSEMRESFEKKFHGALKYLTLDEQTSLIDGVPLWNLHEQIADYWLKVLSSEKEKWIRGEMEMLKNLKIPVIESDTMKFGLIDYGIQTTKNHLLSHLQQQLDLLTKGSR